MKISFLEIVGFRGAKDKIRLDFPAGFVIICGRNDSGKSTLCDAIEYALRGKIDKTYLSETEKGETVADYVWWRGKETALLENAITSRRRQMSEIEKHIAVLETSAAIEKAISLDRDVAAARKAASECEKQLERLESAKSRADRLYSTLRRITGEIVDEQLAALSPLFAELYFRLRPHIDWPDVKYHIRGDVRRFLSLRVGDELNLRFMFSSGQRRATGLAFLLAVNQSLGWSKFKTLILDDPVQHIDDYRALHLSEVLASFRLSKHQIICTVEDSALADLLCRRLRSSESEEGVLINMEYSAGEGAKVVSQQKIYPTIREVLLSA